MAELPESRCSVWKDTEVTRRLGLAVPIVQGPFGSGLSAVELVVAVSESGGLGSFGVHHLEGKEIVETAAKIRARTARPFALNLWIPLGDADDPQFSDAQFDAWRAPLLPYFEQLGVAPPVCPARFMPRYTEQVEALLSVRPAVFSFVFGVPSPDVILRCRELGIATVGTATTPAEARLLESSGVDNVVATGFEAGGHRVSFLQPAEDCLTGTLALVPQVVDAVKIPVIAAGGIADGRGIAAALMLGAQAVQIGTAFLACDESGASPAHRQRLLRSSPTETVLTRAHTGRLARGIRNRFADDFVHRGYELPPYPVHAWLTAQLKTAALAAGRMDLLALWSGQAAPLLKHKEARKLIRHLIDDTTGQIGLKFQQANPVTTT